MADLDKLEPVTAQPGTPLYVAAQERLLDAIRRGLFAPGQKLPSTQEISKVLRVSLVTSHRALQELESQGAVTRFQGRGTFVTDAKDRNRRRLRLRLLMQPEASLADYYHGQVLEGMTRASREAECELSIVQRRPHAEPGKSDASGYILLNPLAEQVDALREAGVKQTPLFIAGARHDSIPWLDVDNIDLIEQAVDHSVDLGHRRLAFVGGADELSNSRDRRAGFVAACDRLRIPPEHRRDVTARAWRLDNVERMAVHQLLSSGDRPTVVIAGGYHLALDIYQVANTLGLSIPTDLSVIGVDDPPSAAHLDPTMTTLAQPLIPLGYAAVHRMVQAIRDNEPLPPKQLLRGELVIRESTGAA